MQAVIDPPTVELRAGLVDALTSAAARPSYRGGYWSFFTAGMLFDLAGYRADLFIDKRVIDLGCGATRPLTTSILFYLLGAESTLALDLEQPTDIGALAVSEYANILAILSGLAPVDWLRAQPDARVCRRKAADFDLAGLLAGDLYSSIPSPVSHKVGRYQDLSEEDRQFGLMISNSVFEHVNDVESLMACARKSIAVNGYVYTSVDFRDHRAYSQSLSPWQYLVDGGDHEPGYINKLRFSAMRSIFERTGFSVVACRTNREPPPEAISNALLPIYRSLTDTDLRTMEAAFLLRPT